VNTNVNRVNTNVNRVNTNVNRVNRVNRPKERNSKVTFPSGSLFAKGGQPKFLGGVKSAVKEPVSNKKPGFFSRLFGKKKNKNFIATNKFKESKEGYVFRKGEQGLGYYLNKGLVQGPQIPAPGEIIQPTPTNEDYSLDLAVARIKQLSLKRESKFLQELDKGISKRKDIVSRAEQAKKEENDLVEFFEKLELTNVNRNTFVRRMATDSFESLKVEAQLKSDQKRNIVRSNEEKMTMFLKTLTLDNTDKQQFINRAKQDGVNIEALISEARKLQETKSGLLIQNKQRQFREILQTFSLSNADKNALVSQVTETANANSMKKIASELIAKRKDEKKNAIQQNLLSFLTPLNIPQTNKNGILRKFRDTNTNINTLKKEALEIQRKKQGEKLNNSRKTLEARLVELGLNQTNQNAIMKKFKNGNTNVNKLIDEAKRVKQRKNTESVNKAKREYRAYLNTLTDLTNKDKEELTLNGKLNRNKALTLAKKRASNSKASQRTNFESFLNQLSLNNTDRANMMSKYNSNTLTMNALKRKATELRNKKIVEKKSANKDTLKEILESSTNLNNNAKIGIMKRFEAGETNLDALRVEITRMIQSAKNTKLANRKKKFANYVGSTSLSNRDKNAFIRKLDDTNLNLNTLRKEVNTMIEKVIVNQRSKDRDELEEYMISRKVTNQNRNSILSKFNANNSISLNGLKQEVNVLLKQRIQEQRATNASNLKAYATNIGLNNASINTLIKKLNRESLNSLKGEADRLVQKMKVIQNQNEKKQLNQYMSKIGLNANNKRNVFRQNLPISDARKFANDLLQKRIDEKRNKNRAALSVIFNRLDLTNDEQTEFFKLFNKNGVNVLTLKKKAMTYAQQKKMKTKRVARAELVNHLTRLGLNSTEQSKFIAVFNRNIDNVNSIKKQASNYINQKTQAQRRDARAKLLQYLKSINIDNSDVNSIMKNFDETNANMNTLMAKAKKIKESRLEERSAELESNFLNYLDTLENLTANNKSNIASKLNSEFTTWNTLKKSATNLAIKRSTERKEAGRKELIQIMNNYGFDKKAKKYIIKPYDNGKKNVNRVKNDIELFKKQYEQQKTLRNQQNFTIFLKTLNLNQKDKNDLIEKFGNGTSTLNNLKKEATNLVNERRSTKRDELFFYVSEIGLENKDRNLIMTNFNKRPQNFNRLKQKANQLKKASNAKELAQIRKELSQYLNTLNMLSKSNKQALLTAPGLSVQNIRNKANTIQKQRMNNKKTAELTKLTNATRILDEENRNYILNKFNTQNVTLNSMLKEVTELKTKSNAKKKSAQRADLYQYINNINLSVEDRNLIMKQFDKTTTNLATMKGQANQMKKKRDSKKLAANRSELEKYIVKTLKLSQTNAKTILAKFNAEQGTLLSLKTNAEELLNRRQNEKRLANRIELTSYFNEIGLSQENGQVILNKFNGTNIPLKNARKEAATLLQSLITKKRAENRTSLVEYMNTLTNLNNVGKKKILKEYDSETANLNTLKNRASQINAATRNKGEQRRELYKYVNGLGINTTPFMNKFDTGRGTLNSLKANADKMRTEINAKSLNKKKDDLRAFMKNSQISQANKNSFINRININTNLNTIKREIRELNKIAEQKKNTIAAKKTELRVFMNTLNNVSNEKKAELIGKVVSNTNNVNQIKNEARALNKAAKNKKVEQERLRKEEEARNLVEAKLRDEKRLEKHLGGLRNITNNRVEYYKQQFAENRATITNLITQSREEDKRQKSEKTAFYTYIRNTKIPQIKKQDYIKKVKAPRSNLASIKKLVNANIEIIRREEVRFQNEQAALNKRKEEEAKKKLEQNVQTLSSELQKLTNLTNENRVRYVNSLRARPSTLDLVLKQARERNAVTKRVKAKNEEEAKRKAEEERKVRNMQTKEVATKLQGLTSLERENRKRFMNRLATNGPQKVLANAQALNRERKNVVAKRKAEEEAKRKAEEETKRKAEEERKVRDAQTRDVATKLQGLTSLERENRKRFMNRLATNGPQKVLANAQALNRERKNVVAKRKAEEEAKRKAEEEAKRKAEEERKVRNTQTKEVATKLQGLTSLERENRKKLMNRLATNGPQKVIADATKLNANRKANARQIRGGVEFKLKKIGVSGSNLKTLMKRWNDSKNKTIFNDARKMISTKRQPLINKVRRVVPAGNNMSQARQKWEAAIREAENDASLQKIERLLESKLKLKARTESEVKDLPPREQSRYLKNFMAYRDDLTQKTQELDRIAKTKRDTKDRATKETAAKLQSMNKLGRDNRKRFMNRVAGGENARKVLTNADKLQRNRSAKQRLEAERKQREQQQAQQRKDREQKTREYEKQKQAKLRGNTARMLQGMSGLERSNRKEFMQRLERGEDPARVISNAQRRDASKKVRPTSGPVPQQGRIAPRTKKMKAKNRTRAQVSRQQQQRRRR
jgi:hypothetical protein